MDGEILRRLFSLRRREVADVLLFQLAPFGRDVLAALDFAIRQRFRAGQLVQPSRGFLVVGMRLGRRLLDVKFLAAFALVGTALVGPKLAAGFLQRRHF